MDLTAERIGHNDAVFRDANERIRAKAAEYGADEPIPFICECDDEGCTQIVSLSLPEYERIRQNGMWFLNSPRHEPRPQEGSIVRENDRYLVLQKVGRAAEIAEERDPRVRETGAETG